MIPGQMEGSFVTILFTDLVGSTSLFENRGDEEADALRREHFGALRGAIAEHGGREVKSTGDGLMVAFPSAVSAVRCAVDMQHAAGDLGLSVGIDAGEPIPEGDDLYGTAVIVASRLCDTAGAGEILASEVVCRVAGPRVAESIQAVGAIRLRGVGQRVAAAQVLWKEEGAAPAEPAAVAREITVVVADDQRLVRAGFRVILEDEPDMTVVGEAPDGQAAVDLVMRTRPDVVLMDIRMPELNGLQAAERILGKPGLDTAVLMLTTFDRDEYIYDSLRIGASGFLLKDAPADRLLEAVRVAAAGDALLAPSVTRRLIEQFARSAPRDPGAVHERLAELTSRELEVLGLIARGLSNSEIAAELVLGENTIKTHVAHVLSQARAARPRAGRGGRIRDRARGARALLAGSGDELYGGLGRQQHRQARARVPRRRPLFSENDRRPRGAAVKLGRQLRRELPRHPAHLLLSGVHGDRVGVVRVLGIPPQLEGRAGLGGLRLKRVGVVLPGPGHARHAQAALGQLGRVAPEEAARLGVDELVSGQPDDAAVLGVPVAVLSTYVDAHDCR